MASRIPQVPCTAAGRHRGSGNNRSGEKTGRQSDRPVGPRHGGPAVRSYEEAVASGRAGPSLPQAADPSMRRYRFLWMEGSGETPDDRAGGIPEQRNVDLAVPLIPCPTISRSAGQGAGLTHWQVVRVSRRRAVRRTGGQIGCRFHLKVRRFRTGSVNRLSALLADARFLARRRSA